MKVITEKENIIDIEGYERIRLRDIPEYKLCSLLVGEDDRLDVVEAVRKVAKGGFFGGTKTETLTLFSSVNNQKKAQFVRDALIDAWSNDAKIIKINEILNAYEKRI